jgi:hypothetical protein
MIVVWVSFVHNLIGKKDCLYIIQPSKKQKIKNIKSSIKENLLASNDKCANPHPTRDFGCFRRRLLCREFSLYCKTQKRYADGRSGKDLKTSLLGYAKDLLISVVCLKTIWFIVTVLKIKHKKTVVKWKVIFCMYKI